MNLDKMSEEEIIELAKNSIALSSKYDGKWYHIVSIEDDRYIHMFPTNFDKEKEPDYTGESYLDVRDIEDKHWRFLSQREVLAIALSKVF
jgi:hypothetical protein